MATVDEGLQTQIRNIEATYGKPMQEWFAVIAASGITKHTEVVAMLKTSYGMTHGAAHRVSLLAAAPPPSRNTPAVTAIRRMPSTRVPGPPCARSTTS